MVVIVELVNAALIMVAALAASYAFTGAGGEVTYDGRSLIIGGQRKILFSGSIHYPRSTPQMWPRMISKAKEGGIDVIATYVFSNLHEPQPGQYDFTGGLDLIGFIKEVQAQGLYVFLRIGPFIEAERSYGGLPIWLREIPGIVIRSDNDPYKDYMQNFTTKIVTMLQTQNLFASQGGPIILSQIENEYSNVERAYGDKGKSYLQWVAQLALGLNTGVPWVMCKQDDAPDPLINACNGKKCGETFVGPNSPNKPAIWTENWTTRYQVYGEDAVVRSATDIAFHTLLFILAKNGTFINYYMYHGGSNFGRSASAFVTTNYYDQAPIDEYGMERQPKWGHLKELHAAVKSCAGPLLSGLQVNYPVGPNQWAYVYNNGETGECGTAFLVNREKHGNTSVSVTFQNASYDLLPKSISILPDCKTVAFNTAKVGSQPNSRAMSRSKVLDRAEMWEEYREVVPSFGDTTSLRSQKLLDHISTTKDASDYLWYTFRFEKEEDSWSNNAALLNVRFVPIIMDHGSGSGHGSHEVPKFNLVVEIPPDAIIDGINNITLLSVTVGMPDSGAYQERAALGPVKVLITDNNHVSHDFTRFAWGYQTSFDAPLEDSPIALNLGSMGKGEAWVNGLSIGRFWPSFRTPNGSSQTWYHVPRSWTKPSGNMLVILEEEGGNPLNISVDTVATTATMSRICSHVGEAAGHLRNRRGSKSKSSSGLMLRCPLRTKISNITFASYGTPIGSCSESTVVTSADNYMQGPCHSINSIPTLEKECLGKKRCWTSVTNQQFNDDPCPHTHKSLLVVAECT
ncbi:Beta-galactosidase 16 [Linum grandiflorum]